MPVCTVDQRWVLPFLERGSGPTRPRPGTRGCSGTCQPSPREASHGPFKNLQRRWRRDSRPDPLRHCSGLSSAEASRRYLGGRPHGRKMRTAHEVHPGAPGALPPWPSVSHTAPLTGPCDCCDLWAQPSSFQHDTRLSWWENGQLLKSSYSCDFLPVQRGCFLSLVLVNVATGQAGDPEEARGTWVERACVPRVMSQEEVGPSQSPHPFGLADLFTHTPAPG